MSGLNETHLQEVQQIVSEGIRENIDVAGAALRKEIAAVQVVGAQLSISTPEVGQNAGKELTKFAAEQAKLMAVLDGKTEYLNKSMDDIEAKLTAFKEDGQNFEVNIGKLQGAQESPMSVIKGEFAKFDLRCDQEVRGGQA